MTDLITLVQKWEKQNHEIIIAVDMNKSYKGESSMVQTLVDNTGLTTLIDKISVATYDRGNKRIEFFLGTTSI
jgi:hypothetical protein